MSEDTKGKVDEAKGKAKKAAGDLTDDKELHNEGKADEAGGKARQKLSDAAGAVGDGIDKATDTVKDALSSDDKKD